jgi:hypothetical protein
MTATQIATYDAARDRWRMLFDLYWGGERVRQPSATTLASVELRWTGIKEDGSPTRERERRTAYLVPHDGESDYAFDQRLALACYVNLVQPIVKAYAEGTTSRVVRKLEALGPFVEDVNRRGSDWGEFAEEHARWAALYGLLFTVVDAPAGPALRTRAEELAAGRKPYCVLVHPTAVAWIAVSPEGRIEEFAYAETPYQPAEGDGKSCAVRLRVWTADRVVDGNVVPGGWSVREGAVSTSGSVAAQASNLRVVGKGPLPAALKGEVPVVASFYDRDASSAVPMGASVVSDAADVARTIYNNLSWASEIHRKAGFPFLALPMGDTGGHLDPQTRIAIGPSKALPYNSTAGAPSWVQPSAESPRELREHCLFLFQLALRTAGLEVAADSSAQVSSGEALRIRSRDYESRAARFANHLRRWELSVLRLLALYAGADPSAITVTYPKRFTLPDLKEDLDRALALLSAPAEIGPVLRAEAIRQAASAALSLTDERLDEAMEPVEAALAEDKAKREALDAAAALVNDEAAGEFAVGDRVRVTGTPHMPGQSAGTVAEVSGADTYGVRFDGTAEVHRWYVGSELAPAQE